MFYYRHISIQFKFVFAWLTFFASPVLTMMHASIASCFTRTGRLCGQHCSTPSDIPPVRRCPPVCSSVCLSVRLSVCLSVGLSVCLTEKWMCWSRWDAAPQIRKINRTIKLLSCMLFCNWSPKKEQDPHKHTDRELHKHAEGHKCTHAHTHTHTGKTHTHIQRSQTIGTQASKLSNRNNYKICLRSNTSMLRTQYVTIYCGAWWRLGWVDSFQPEGRGFDSRSSLHVGTLGKSFTCSCLCASAWNSDTVSVL